MCDIVENATPWIDRDFLETILARHEDDAHLSVVNFDVHSAVPKGDNYASTLMRVKVEYTHGVDHNNKDAKTKSLIVKTLPAGEMMQIFITTIGFFEKETHMYDTTLPSIYRLFVERTGSEHEHLATDLIFNDRKHTIVLEDLKPSGYVMANRREGLNLNHSVKALRTLAKLHASSLVLNLHEPTVLDFYEESFYIEKNRPMLVNFMEPVFSSLALEVETWTGFEKYVDKLKEMATTCVDRTIELVKCEEGAIRVLNHGDFWTNNMLFKYEDGKLVDCKILDFQMVRFNSPALDLLYFLHTSPSQNILEDHWDTMIEEYQSSLSETLKLLNHEELTISLDQINQELKDKAYFAVIVSAMFCIMVAEPEDAPDFSEITEENMESHGAKSMNKAFAGKRFRHAFERRLPKFEAEGLLQSLVK